MSYNFGTPIPLIERVKYLWAVGYTPSDIANIVNEEFSDIAMSSFSGNLVRKMYMDNKEDFDSARAELTVKCREELQAQVALMFSKTSNVEVKLVQVFVDKLNIILDQLAVLDISETEDGKMNNKAAFFSLLEAAERLQSKISKVAGTDAFREIEVYRQKAGIKKEFEEEGNKLIPMRDATPTKWIE